jgi:hypothetical protein
LHGKSAAIKKKWAEERGKQKSAAEPSKETQQTLCFVSHPPQPLDWSLLLCDFGPMGVSALDALSRLQKEQMETVHPMCQGFEACQREGKGREVYGEEETDANASHKTCKQETAGSR